MSSDTLIFGMTKREIVEQHFDTVYRLALSQTKNKADAEDITQDVFLRFVQNSKPFSSPQHIKAWLIRVTINCSKSTFTNSWVKKTVPLTDDITFEIPEQEDVYYAVAKLPKKYRAVIHLFYYEDLSIKEIADYLSIKESTVKSQLHRGREMLKQILGRGSEFEF